MRTEIFLPGTRKWLEFLKNEDGVVTVEALLWLPIYFGAFMLMTDVAMIYNGQTLVYKTVQDANRNASIGFLSTPADVENYVSSNIQSFAPNAAPHTTISGGSVVTTVSVPATDLIITGWFDALAGFDVTVSGTHVIEF